MLSFGRAQWSQRYNQLVQYRAINGNCCVPKAQGPLGRWVARQRELRKKNAIQPDREAKLNELGFVWNTNDNAWDQHYERLKEYRDVNRHVCVPIAAGVLGVWVAKQRQLKRRGKLAANREERLNDLGFVWDTPSLEWNEKFEALQQWKAAVGDCRVPFNAGELGWWVNTQRQRKRKGQLQPDREAKLNAIGFIWNPQGRQPTSADQHISEDDVGRGGGNNGGASAGPSTSPAIGSSSDAGPSRKPRSISSRRPKRRISDDGSESQGSKRHHSDLSESSVGSNPFLPRQGSESSMGSYQQLLPSRYGYLDSSSQSSFDSSREDSRPGTPVGGHASASPLPSLYHHLAGGYGSRSATAPSTPPTNFSVGVRLPSAENLRSYTASTTHSTSYSRNWQSQMSHRRALSGFDLLPSVQSLGALPSTHHQQRQQSRQPTRTSSSRVPVSSLLSPAATSSSYHEFPQLHN